MFTFAAEKTSLRNQKGFSLVELMVVVAIIGILAAIAVPSLNKYMAKARQSEAKTNLAGLYSAEKAFIAEYNTYASCFDGIGYRPEGRLRYRIGFGADLIATAAADNFTGTCTAGSFNTSVAAVCTGVATCIETQDAAGLPATALAKSTFTAGAGSQLVAGAPVDQWTMSNAKILTNTQDGIR